MKASILDGQDQQHCHSAELSARGVPLVVLVPCATAEAIG